MRFSFGDFRLDPETHELLRGTRPVAVQPKVFKLLLHLVMNRHRCVTNEELLTTLWPGETVSPASVTSCVRSARRVLGDAGTSQGIIRTVRGHGYRFVLPVIVEAHPSPPSAPGRTMERHPPRAEHGTSPTDFIGRADVLAALDEALAKSEAGYGHCLLLTGEPGVGKTRTLHELAACARERGARVWLARCLEGAGAPTFWPIVQLLREAADDLGPDRLRTAVGGAAVDIAHGLPELRRWLGALPETSAPEGSSARFRFFDGFATFLRRVAEEQPLVLLLDDLQQVDEPTARLLVFAAQQIERARVLIGAATRPVDGSSIPALIRDLLRPAASTCIDLQGFSQGDLAFYLTRRTGFSAPDPVVAELRDQTAGNPLYVQQLVAGMHLPAAGFEPDWQQLLQRARGGGIGAAIERQLETLGEPARRLLQTASVLGRDFSLGLLIEVSGAQRDEAERERALRCLAEARSAGLVFTLDGPTHYRFKHTLVREALYKQMATQERLRLHLAAGLALEARGAGANATQLAQLADHFQRAAPIACTGRALHYTLAAARDARAKLAYEEAAAHLERALGLLEFDAPDPHQRLALLLARGEALFHATRSTDARRVLSEAAELARGLGDRDGLLKAVSLAARCPEHGAANPALVSWLREALALLGPDDPRRAELTALLAKALSYSREVDERIRLALDAYEQACRADVTHHTETLYACHQALAGPETLSVRMQISDALTSLGRRLGDPVVLMHGAITRLWNAVERGDASVLDWAMSEMESLAPGLREPLFDWCTSMFRATRAFVEGDLASARQSAERALGYGTLVGEEFAQHAHATQVYGILFLQGRFVEAEALAQRLSGRYPALASWRTTLAVVHAYLGHTARARSVLEDLLADDLAALRSEPYWLGTFAPAAQLCAFVGDAALARPLYAALLPYADRCGVVAFAQSTHGPISRLLGLLSLRMGDLPLALKHLEDAVEHAERMRSPTFVSFSCLSYATALREVGTRRAYLDAREMLARADRIAAESRLSTVSMLCRRLDEQLKQTEPSRLTLQRWSK